MSLNPVSLLRELPSTISTDSTRADVPPNLDDSTTAEKIAAQATTTEKLLDAGNGGLFNKPSKTEPDYSDLTIPERQDRIDDANDEYDRTGDPSAFDGVDTFRQHLSPDQQIEYDKYVEEVRNNDGINIRYWDGAQQDALTDELVYRGIAASTFGDRDDLRKSIEVAEQYELNEHPDWSTDTSNRNGVPTELSNDDGQFDVYIYPPGSDNPAGQVVASGDIIIDQGALKGIHQQADNLVIHEFAHVEQGITESRSLFDRVLGREGEFSYSGKSLPQGFPDSDLFFERAASDDFDNLLEVNGLLGDQTSRDNAVANQSGEVYATVVNLFTQQPQALKTADPQMYDLMVEHLGFDPLG
jgi:hypothetical protein